MYWREASNTCPAFPTTQTGPDGGVGSRIPFLADGMVHALHSGSYFLPHPESGPVDESRPPLSLYKGKPYIMGLTAEFVAQYLDISREDMDEVALRSHNNAERATADGSFEDEIVPVELPSKKGVSTVFSKDEHFRPGLTLEKLRKLPPAFIPNIGKVTAGNSSGNQRRSGRVGGHVRVQGGRIGSFAHGQDQGGGKRWLPPLHHGAFSLFRRWRS